MSQWKPPQSIVGATGEMWMLIAKIKHLCFDGCDVEESRRRLRYVAKDWSDAMGNLERSHRHGRETVYIGE